MAWQRDFFGWIKIPKASVYLYSSWNNAVFKRLLASCWDSVPANIFPMQSPHFAFPIIISPRLFLVKSHDWNIGKFTLSQSSQCHNVSYFPSSLLSFFFFFLIFLISFNQAFLNGKVPDSAALYVGRIKLHI